MVNKTKKLELTANKYWLSEDQSFTESVYMLQTFAGYYGKDERYWGHHKGQLEVINQLDISNNLVLPYVHTINGTRTIVLLEFELDKSFDYSPVQIKKWSDEEIVATLEKRE